jgi:lysozyme family protein
MSERFDECLRLLLVSEGGLSDHPSDNGGRTQYGITKAVYDAYRDLMHQPRRMVDLISQAEVSAIYRRQYWNAVHGDELPAGIDYAVFDYAVNSGAGRACRALQAALMVQEDGKIGLITLGRARSGDPAQIINRLCDARLAFLNTLDDWSVFGKGWSNRVHSVRSKALAMAAKEHA